MEVRIINKELQKLYNTGRSGKYKLQPHIVFKFLSCIEKIEAATDIYDLQQAKSLHFEKLTNKQLYSMRLNDQYRLEMKIEWLNDSVTIGVFDITDISNHYQ
ncbi:MAG: type II toxin-antitoxin system RelE/ParE family toxin [Prevotellaceae bacterium]|jgi:plasmid maintenance system killer protein|nr:type II toxin-antitoxin system RelE/ParE family toxin [Prevotellaceae bacterium]